MDQHQPQGSSSRQQPPTPESACLTTPGANPRKTIRAFTGLVGRPPEPHPEPDTTTHPPGPVLVPPPKRKRGRPPIGDKAMTPAECMRRSRSQADRKSKINELEAEQKREASMDKNNKGIGMYMPDAPTGVGALVTGGYNGKKLTDVVAARERVEAIGGRKAKPLGASCKEGDLDDSLELAGGSSRDACGLKGQVFSEGRFDVRLGKSDDEQERQEVFKMMIEAGRCEVCQAPCLSALNTHVQDAVEAETAHYEKAQEYRSNLEQIGADPRIIGPEPKPGDHVICFDRILRWLRKQSKVTAKSMEVSQKANRDLCDYADALAYAEGVKQKPYWNGLREKRDRDFKNKKARERRAAKKAKSIS